MCRKKRHIFLLSLHIAHISAYPWKSDDSNHWKQRELETNLMCANCHHRAAGIRGTACLAIFVNDTGDEGKGGEGGEVMVQTLQILLRPSLQVAYLLKLVYGKSLTFSFPCNKYIHNYVFFCIRWGSMVI